MRADISFNTAQKQAIEHVHGPCMVVAGAGTGKTAVITQRIARLIQQESVPAEQILALTFTEKAAAEMQQRLDEVLPYGYVDTEILTFHSLGDKILREFGVEIGIQSDFEVLSSFQQILVMQQVVLSTKLLYYKSLSNPFGLVSDILQFISRLKDEAIDAKSFESFVKKQTARKNIEKDEKDRLRELANIYLSYEEYCRKHNLVDYGDQILLCLKLFKARKAVTAAIQQRFAYILVDEYQDTNFVQAELIKLLAGAKQNIMVVGDDDQSIYQFRGATLRGILDFEKSFDKVKRIVLTQNYRNSQKILDRAYEFIQNNNPYRLESAQGFEKKLIGNKKPSVFSMQDYQNINLEVEAIADKISQLQKKKIPYSQMAILLRKNSQAKLITQVLHERSIPFMVSESQNLLEQPEIRLLINFVRALHSDEDSEALYSFLVSDVIREDVFTVSRLASSARKSHEPLESYLRSSPSTEKTQQAFEYLDRYRAASSDEGAGQLLYSFIRESGYLKSLVDQAEQSNDAVAKVQNISQFFALIREYEQASSNNNNNIFGFLNYILDIRKSEADIMIEPSPLDIDAVSVMTIHKAKGLEFEAVFIPDMTEQTFPSSMKPERIRVPELLYQDTELDKKQRFIQEERRLLYVAITRAKQAVYLSFSYDHGKKRLKKPSRFLHELSYQDRSGSKTTNTSLRTFQIDQYSKPVVLNGDYMGKYIAKDDWLHLSVNQIADYVRSPREFWYFDVLSLPKGPFHTLVYGSAIHAALEVFYKALMAKRQVDLTDIISTYENSWKSEGFVSLQHEKDRFQHGRELLTQYCSSSKNKKDIPIHIEKPFLLRLPGIKLAITGRYDAVFARPGGVEIRDFKTSEVTSEESARVKLRDSIQMKIYALAWGKANQEPVETVSLHFVESDILAISSKINNEKTLDLLEKASSGIRNSDFDEKGQSRLNLDRLM